jgi:hypothetical protein
MIQSELAMEQACELGQDSERGDSLFLRFSSTFTFIPFAYKPITMETSSVVNMEDFLCLQNHLESSSHRRGNSIRKTLPTFIWGTSTTFSESSLTSTPGTQTVRAESWFGPRTDPILWVCPWFLGNPLLNNELRSSFFLKRTSFSGERPHLAWSRRYKSLAGWKMQVGRRISLPSQSKKSNTPITAKHMQYHTHISIYRKTTVSKSSLISLPSSNRFTGAFLRF